MKRELPVFKIEGTDFMVDVVNLQLIEKEKPDNMIPVFDMRDVDDGYVFDYNLKEKNIPMWSNDNDARSVKIPELVKLDPVGMAEKYGIPVQMIRGKTDFELMVDQQALGRRLMGQLTTVDISGHIFFVDIPMDMLRPKDDFSSKGIVFSKIDHYYDDEQERCIIPYNKKTHEFQELDYDNITSIPKNLILISFPHESVLDPVGYNRKGGWDETYRLKETNVKSYFEAKSVDWKEFGLEHTIEQNINKEHQQRKSKIKDLKPHKGKRRSNKL